ncbi:hypothetical protein [Curvibacter delicatus]|uniref:hypothetical protein n=1 Tax=Curvibacter delicatus TaxID=80879 RepID=UPI0014723BD0|nr:hypothetical protein [Curvibacter delicatus]
MTALSKSATAGLERLVMAAKAEASLLAADQAESTRKTYEANARRLAAGWDLESTAAKGTRYAMRAAGLWTMRKQLKKALKEADKIKKNGMTGEELFVMRELQWAASLEKVRELMDRIDAFKALPWDKPHDKERRQEKSHKQRAATDAQLEKFFATAAKSSFREAFLAMEFAGVRGEELGKGVRIEAIKKNGVPTLSFFIESVKADGRLKGLDLRRVDVPFPAKAAKPVQRRWMELAKAAAKKGGHVVQVSKTENQSVGQRLTQNFRDIAKRAGVPISSYALRQRYSAQVKASNPGDAVAVALALGHQTTETQRHYARRTRGKGGISPVESIGVNIIGAKIRGATARTGPPLHVKEKVSLSAIAAPPPASAAPRPRGPRM